MKNGYFDSPYTIQWLEHEPDVTVYSYYRCPRFNSVNSYTIRKTRCHSVNSYIIRKIKSVMPEPEREPYPLTRQSFAYTERSSRPCSCPYRA